MLIIAMYSFGIIVGAGLWFILRKKPIKLRIIFSVVAALVAIEAVGLSNVETLFAFETPEKAVKAMSFGEVIEVIEGEETVMVVSKTNKNGSNINYCLLDKTPRGYKVDNAWERKKEKQKVEGGIIEIETAAKTGEKYMSIHFESPELITTVTDSVGNELDPHLIWNYENKKIYWIFAYVGKDSEGYTIFVDGKPLESVIE